MLLWTVFALLTAAVIWALALPLMREHDEPSIGTGRGESQSPDIAVYRDQLAEIELDVQRGLVSADEAQGARAEVGRRILAASEPRGVDHSDYQERHSSGAGAAGKSGTSQVSILLYVIAIVVPLLSAGLYAFVGSPGMPGSVRIAQEAPPQEKSDLEDSLAKVEAHLRIDPQDGRGWNVIAPIYMGLGRYDDARVAYRQAALLLGADERRLIGLGRASVFAEKGKVTGEAHNAFQRVLKIAPANLEARLWLARFSDQQGDVKDAINAYDQLLADSAQDAPWRNAVEQRLGELRGELSGKAAVTVDRDTVDVVSEMSETERAEFIGRMVDGLAARLKASSNDIDGWVRLVRAYSVIGRSDDAKVALGRARKIFMSDESKLSRLDGLAKELGLGS